jgi:hemerythrin superfamily protein
MQIYDILKQEHEEVRQLLNELVALKDDDEYRFVLVQEIQNALIPHARAEESVFYNTIRAVDADKSIVAHAYKEHLEAESLLRMLQVKDKTNMDWRSTARKLRDSVEHHVAEEESTVFSEARKIFTAEEAESIGEAFTKLRPSFVGDGVMKNTLDMVINMLPPRLADSIRGISGNEKQV